MFKKMLAAIAATLLAVGGAVLATTPAAAHTGDLTVEWVCNTATGEYDGTAYLAISQTGLTGSTMWRVGTTTFDGTPSNANGMDRGPVASNGSGTITLGSFSIPGTSTKAPWVYAFTVWSDQYSKGSDGGNNNLGGNCSEPDSPTASAELNFTPPTCTDPGGVSLGAISHATFGELYVNGLAYSVTATADTGYTFPGGESALVLQGTLPGPDKSLCPQPRECPAITTLPTATDTNPQGWSIYNGEWVEGGVLLRSSNWSDSWAYNPNVSFPLTDAPELAIDFTLDGGGATAIIFQSTAGWIHYEPYYSDPLWMTVPGVLPANGGGQGGPYSGDFDDLLSNPTIFAIHVYFGSGSAEEETAVLHSASFNCTKQPFSRSQAPTPEKYTTTSDGTPDCAADAVPVTTYYWKITFEFVNGKWEPQEPFQWKEPTVADRPLTEGEVIENCETEPPVPPTDECNAAPSVPEDTDTYEYSVVTDKGIITVTAHPKGVYYFPEGTVTEWTFNEDDPCPIPTVKLPNTGIEVPLWPLVGGGMLLLAAGSVLFLSRRHS